MSEVPGNILSDHPVIKDNLRVKAMRSIQAKVEHFFMEHGDEFEKMKALAEAVSSAVEKSGRFVEHHTSVVCPECLSVCCVNRHSYLEAADMVCICALGGSPPLYKAEVGDEEPCQFLGEKGCILKRPLRPHRCNWYFCAPLLEDIQTVPPQAYRAFIAGLREINEKRETLLTIFCDVLKKTGYEPESPINVLDEIYLRDNFFARRFDIL